MKKNNSVYVKEPIFLSPTDLHFKMTDGIERKNMISELKSVREQILTSAYVSDTKKISK